LVIFPDNHLSSGAYAAEINDFSKRFEVIAFDYPTPGKSTQKVKYPDDREVDYWWFWADLACHLLVELEIDRCFELGVGGGALVGLHFSDEQASDHPIEVQGIVLDSFLAKMDTRTLHRWLDERELFYDRNKKSLREPHGENWRAVVDQDTQYLWKLADRGGYQEPEFILNTIACPVLLTGRLEDRILPNLALEYAQISRLIPNCSIYLSSKANHATLERPFMRTDSDCFQCLTDLFSKRLLNLD
jgi:pimeloyl-ACP methyl ester carboxylesterase